MSDSTYRSLLERVLDDKAALRQELRSLPIEDKIKIIALMQRRSNEIRRATGRPPRPQWSWEAVGLSTDSPPPPAGSLLARLGIYEIVLNEGADTGT